ncbi:MAG: nucleoside phosphorylase [Alphaproteobacteria bacterium]
MNRVGVVTGMAAEARCLPRPAAGDGPVAVCSGGDAARAVDLARELVASGAEALLSFGIAGGLAPSLETGAVVVADAVIGIGGTRRETDSAWRKALCDALTVFEPRGGAVAGSAQAVVSPRAKRELFATTDACIVDLESEAVARAAGDGGVPFAVLRVVADTAGRTLPGAALAGLGAGGRLRPGAVLAGLAKRPWETPGVVMLARDTARALAVLGRAASAVEPLLRRGPA